MTAGADTSPRVVSLPPVGAIVGHALPSVVEATVVPFVLFYGALQVAGVWWALGAALAWSVAAVGRRLLLTGGRVPGVLVLGTMGTAVRTVIAVLSGSVFVYFLQPTLGTVVVAGAFLLSVPAGRPMIQRLVQDFLPLPAGFCDDPRVRRLFARLTLAWGAVHLANAGITLWLLVSQPLEVFLVARTAAAAALTVVAIACSTAWFVAAGRRVGVHVSFRLSAGTALPVPASAPAAAPVPAPAPALALAVA